MNEVRIRHLKVGDAVIDLSLNRYAGSVAVGAYRHGGDVEVVINS